MTLTELKSIIQSKEPDFQLVELEQSTPEGFKVEKEQLKELCVLLRDNDQLFFDMLSSITGIDNGPEADTMEVMYHLYSLTNEQSLSLKVELNRENPLVPTISDVWKAADWHEREVFDLYGVQFDGHPDLRRILLPNDWEGYPLRKDYQEQERYHGITVSYEENRIENE
jgi:NADH-quinone oxidoreductase subunit C